MKDQDDGLFTGDMNIKAINLGQVDHASTRRNTGDTKLALVLEKAKLGRIGVFRHL